MAKNSLERYTHYYERWATNESVSLRLVEWAVCACIFLFSVCICKSSGWRSRANEDLLKCLIESEAWLLLLSS
jgi:hypothetical protein